MSEEQSTGNLSLFGITMNAMALIAPGAFLWITFQLQAQTGYQDMWFGIVFAVIVAFSTAFPYAELARKYPDAGCGGAYNFARSAFANSKSPGTKKQERKVKLVVGWSSHLFYWVYPGVMVGFMATLIDYIASCDGSTCPGGAIPVPVLALLSLILACMVGSIAWKGAEGSTSVSIVINVIQLSVLVFFSALCFAYRSKGENSGTTLADVTELPTWSSQYGTSPAPLGFPTFDGKPLDENNTALWTGAMPVQYGEGKGLSGPWAFESVGDVLAPSSFSKMLLQASVAILILVGFDSATSMGAEAKNPKRDIPRGVILSITIQGCGAYLLEYFAANAAIDNVAYTYTCDDSCAFAEDTAGKILYGMDAVAESSAPIGDLAIVVGNEMLSGGGFGLMMVMAISTLLACVGSTLAAMNTAVRFSQAMAQDDEFPSMFSEEHSKFHTPYKGIICQVLWSFFIGSISACVEGGALAVTLASNIGTFALYLMVCITCYVSFKDDPDRSFVKHVAVPCLGGFLNILMLLTIFIVGLMDDASRQSVIIALCLAAVWTVVTVVYWSRGSGKVAPNEITVASPTKLEL